MLHRRCPSNWIRGGSLVSIRKNIGLGLMIFSVLGLLVLFSGQILALSTGGYQGNSYGIFDNTVIDTNKFTIGPVAPNSPTPPYAESRKCQVAQGPTGDFGARLELRGCPLDVDLLNNKVQVLAKKDFYGQDIRIVANIKEGTGRFFIGDFDSGNYKEVTANTGYTNVVIGSSTNSVPVGQTDVLLEVIPSGLDPRNVEIFMDGRLRETLTLQSIDQMQIAFQSNTGYVLSNGESQPGSFNILVFNYEPQFGACDVRNGELLVTQTFAGGQVIDIASFEFDPIRFCPGLPALIIDQQAQATDTNFEILQILKAGGSHFIPAHQNIEIRYVMNNNDGTGNVIIPTICTNATYDVITKQCMPRIGTLQLCDGQLVGRDCVTVLNPTPVCPEGSTKQGDICVTVLPTEGVCPVGSTKQENQCVYLLPSTTECEAGATLREDGTCVKRIPSTQVMCEDGTIVQGTTGTECQARVDDCEVGFTRKEIDGGRFECVSDTKPEQIFSNAGNEVVQTAVSTTASVTEAITDERPNQKTALKQLLAVLLVIIFVIGVILYMWKRGRR